MAEASVRFGAETPEGGAVFNSIIRRTEEADAFFSHSEYEAIRSSLLTTGFLKEGCRSMRIIRFCCSVCSTLVRRS